MLDDDFPYADDDDDVLFIEIPLSETEKKRRERKASKAESAEASEEKESDTENQGIDDERADDLFEEALLDDEIEFSEEEEDFVLTPYDEYGEKVIPVVEEEEDEIYDDPNQLNFFDELFSEDDIDEGNGQEETEDGGGDLGNPDRLNLFDRVLSKEDSVEGKEESGDTVEVLSDDEPYDEEDGISSKESGAEIDVIEEIPEEKAEDEEIITGEGSSEPESAGEYDEDPRDVEYEGGPESYEETELDTEDEWRTDAIEVNTDLPPMVAAISSRLDSSSSFTKFVIESDRITLDYMENVIKRSWEKMMDEGRAKMFSVYDSKFSVIIANNRPMDSIMNSGLRNSAGAVMYSVGSSDWSAVIVETDDNYKLVNATEERITPESFSVSDWKICKNVGRELALRRGK